MTDAQLRAFKAASRNAEPALLNTLFVGVLIALLFLWAGWALLHVYRGYAAGRIKGQAMQRVVIRMFLLIVISLFLFAS